MTKPVITFTPIVAIHPNSTQPLRCACWPQERVDYMVGELKVRGFTSIVVGGKEVVSPS